MLRARDRAGLDSTQSPATGGCEPSGDRRSLAISAAAPPALACPLLSNAVLADRHCFTPHLGGVLSQKNRQTPGKMGGWRAGVRVRVRAVLSGADRRRNATLADGPGEHRRRCDPVSHLSAIGSGRESASFMTEHRPPLKLRAGQARRNRGKRELHSCTQLGSAASSPHRF